MSRPLRDLAGAAVGGAVLVATGAFARRPLTNAEKLVFRGANALPDGMFWPTWVPMQYGTFGTVPALAGLAFAGRRPRMAAGVALGGTAAWLLAKGVKPLVGRGRPADVLPDVRQRGKEEGDLGFPSGHAAVSAALTFVLWQDSAKRWRLACAALSGFVPFARLYVGAHLPLDVVGGSALGVGVGSLANLVVRRRPPARGRLKKPVR